MSRPRIRTLKPDAPRDERVGRLSRDARLLFFTGLVALADDEGRLRAMPSAIIGDVFPYDADVTPAKLRRWLSEIEAEQLILSYEADGIQYLAIRHWKRHQRINRPSPSVLPPPPDQSIVTENSVNDHGTDGEDSVDDHEVLTTESHPHAQARVPLPSTPAVVEENSNVPSRAEFEEWLLHHEQTTGHTAPRTGTKARAAIVEAFGARQAEGYPLSDLKLATVGAHEDEYRRTNGYDTAESVLRPTKVAALIARGRLRGGGGPRRTDVAAQLDRAYGRTGC